MKDATDIVTWVIGGLAAIAFFNYKARVISDNEKFKALFDQQRKAESKVAAMDAELKGISAHFIQTLDDIKNQNYEMGRDITEIKVGLAAIPKRRNDDDR